MALARVKTWSSGEVLTASDLNAEFNNLLNNARDLVSPLTGSLDMNGNEFILDGDADSSFTADTDDKLDLRLGGVDLFIFDGTTASCVNGLTFTGTATGSGPVLSATGSDTNIDINLTPKGTGDVVVNADQRVTGASIVQNSQSAAYTTVAADANKHILHPTADNNARTFTIDSNDNVPYAIGTCITFVNQINTVTIAITSDTMTLAGTSTTGSRTLAANGIATALKVSSTGWLISGVGLT